MTKEVSEKLDEKINELNALQRKTFSQVRQSVLDLLGGGSFDDEQLKAITTRLPLHDYATLKVLASRLNQSSLSSLARILLLASLTDAVNTYLSASGVDAAEFMEAVNEVEVDLLQEV